MRVGGAASLSPHPGGFTLSCHLMESLQDSHQESLLVALRRSHRRYWGWNWDWLCGKAGAFNPCTLSQAFSGES